MIAVKTYKFTVIQNDYITKGVRLTKVYSQEELDFKAGQYFSFKIKDKVNRSYSISSKPDKHNLEFLVEIIPNGLGSTFIDHLIKDDEFEAIGPLGFLTLDKIITKPNDAPLMFVGTGSGIAPLRSMIQDLLLNHKSQRQIDLYFGIRHDEFSYFFDEFENLSKEFSNFRFYPVVSQPSSDWKGNVGHCQDIVIKNPLVAKAYVYVCGSNKNVDSICEALIQYGYQKENIFFEKYG